MITLTHITSAENAFNILSSQCFCSMNNYGSYDGGMNFLGVLGENANTQPKDRGARIHFLWEGKVSDPISWDAYNYDSPNILYDFNGSGKHFPNNDPRYFLPYNSEGLKVTKLEFDSEDKMLEGWCNRQKGILLTIYNMKVFNNFLLRCLKNYLNTINYSIRSGNLTITIKRAQPNS